ncbi:hypothetical protein [Lysobacter silvisoli]|uniref:Uncharacterized protein n=1 Tax=Lysobacter silvisoli TaxID=2293254 RepID=A0A371JWU9_9GAMM|nr:hypothetical protein [Lysobacter silvisoli]RDZ26149.1 hypothetical protein DX914_17915 [Lysobacter silvisoli]
MNPTRSHTHPRAARAAALASLLALTAACASSGDRASASAADPLAPLRPLCGQAYAGRIVASTPEGADAAFAGQPLVMHVRDCGAKEIRVPFHVGDDRSRTWVFTAHGDALRLKHDHRHADGSEDALTQYGGDQRGKAVAGRYEFPADAYSQAMFRAQGRAVSVPNVWAVEVDAQRYVYELARPGRLFRVEFDLSKPVAPPPPPWGG